VVNLKAKAKRKERERGRNEKERGKEKRKIRKEERKGRTRGKAITQQNHDLINIVEVKTVFQFDWMLIG
jgi:hypothetical protein